MTLRIIPNSEAQANLTGNAFANWPSRLDSSNRIEPVCTPGLKPTFKLNSGEKIYTTGSCFARNVEDALSARGFYVVNKDVMELGPEFTQMRRGILNNYGIPSMFNELDWALNPNAPFDEDRHFFEVSHGKFVDINLPPRIRPAALNVVRERRQAIINVSRRVVECSTIVMTLGLVEAWFDREADRYVNYAPPRLVTSKYPNRFELHVLDYETSLHYLRKILTLLSTHCPADHKILLTVSPVPLLATFTAQDVIIANTYSKSLLRVVAEAIASENANVDYYPSYESVTLSDRKITWKEDQHHVRDDVVAINVGRMIHAYTDVDGRAEHSVPEAINEARTYWRAKDAGSAMRCLESVASELTSVEDLLFYAVVSRAAGLKEQALRIALALPEGGNVGAQVSKADLLLKLGATPQAQEVVESILAGTPSASLRILALRVLVRILSARKAYDEAVVAAKQWASLTPSRADALLAVAEIYRAMGKLEPACQAYVAAMERAPTNADIRLTYAELLISYKNFDEARGILTGIETGSPQQASRLRELNLFASA